MVTASKGKAWDADPAELAAWAGRVDSERAADARATLDIAGIGDPRLASILGIGGDDATGISVSETTALNISGVWRALTVTSNAIGKLPLALYRRTEQISGLEGRDRLTRSALARMLNLRPNPEMSAFSLWSSLVIQIRQWGNGFIEIERNEAGRPIGLWPIHASRCELARVNGRLGLWVHMAGSETSIEFGGTPGEDGRVWLPYENVLHVPNVTFNGLSGVSTLSAARYALGLSKAAERYGAKFFGNSGRPSGVLTHPQRLDNEVAARIRESWRQNYGGANAQGTAVLEEGMGYQPISIPPEDAQFIETRKLQNQELARFYEVPLHILMDMGGATFSNIEHQAAEFRENTVHPLAAKIEQEIDYKLLGRIDRGNLYARFDLDALVQPTAKERAETAQLRRNTGTHNADELRVLEGDSPLPDGAGQVYWHPVNMAVLRGDGSAVLPYRPAEKIDAGNGQTIDSQTLPAIEPSDETIKREAAPETAETRETEDAPATLAALRPVFGDVYERIVARERRAVAGKKAPDAAWMAGWRQKHTEWVADQLLAPVRAALAAQGIEEGRDAEEGVALSLAAGVAAEWCEGTAIEPRQDDEADRLVGAAIKAVEVTAWM